MEKNRRVEAVPDPAAANIPLEYKRGLMYQLRNGLLETSSTASFVAKDYKMKIFSLGFSFLVKAKTCLSISTVCTLLFGWISPSKKTSDFEAIVRNIARYLFRVHSSKSQGSFSSSRFHADRKPAIRKEYSVELKALFSAHLLWQHTPSYWISTTSSLL